MYGISGTSDWALWMMSSLRRMSLRAWVTLCRSALVAATPLEALVVVRMVGQRHGQRIRDLVTDAAREVARRFVGLLRRRLEEVDGEAVAPVEGGPGEVPDHVGGLVRRVVRRPRVAHGHLRGHPRCREPRGCFPRARARAAPRGPIETRRP